MKNQNLENKNKVEAANKVLAFAKELGFSNAFLSFEDESSESFYDSVENIVSDYEEGDEVTIRIHLTLDEDLQFDVNADDEITYT